MAVKSEKKENVRLLYGNDLVSLSLRKEELIKTYFKGEVPDTTVLESPGNYESCKNALGGQSLFFSKTAVIIQNPFFLKKTVRNEKEEKESEKEPEILQFVDVYGQQYSVEINQNIAKKQYNDTLFIHDGDRLTYADEKYTSRLGIDVSYHQGEIDWKKVKAAGYDFAFIRIGYRGYAEAGTVNADIRFDEYIQQAQNAGLDVGVYFFSQAVNEEEAREEAQFVLDHLSGYNLQLPVVFDPESILDDDARTDHVSGEQFTKNTEAFCSAIEAAGYDAMIYSNMLWEAYELDLEKLSAYPVWYADYELKPQTPYHFEVWQYTNQGSVDGINGRTDINIQLIEKPSK